MTRPVEGDAPWWSAFQGLEVDTPPDIVIVDDQSANVLLLERLLAGVSVKLAVHSFTDPEEALDHCRTALPSLILLDLHMPQMDGIAFMERLRDLVPRDVLLPVLILTADVTAESKERALAAGARDFVTKPFDRTEVLLRVANLLEIRALHDRLSRHNAQLRAELDVRMAAEREADAERSARLRRINQALAPGGLAMAFQPVADITSGRIVGAEALARFAPEPCRPPDEWFREAESVGLGLDLELAAVAAALSQLDQLPADGFIAVNVSPSTAMTFQLRELLSVAPPSRIVLEVTEHTKVEDYDALIVALEPLRAAGVRIAVDDTGAGYAGFQSLLRLRPDILKLDTTLTRGIDADPIRRALAAALVTFAAEIDAPLIAEGIEVNGELKTLRRIGIPWGQGYHLARPGPLPLPHAQIASLVAR